MNDAYKTISSEYILKGEWINLRKDAYKTPTGKIVEPYYVYEFATWVAALPITIEGKVILIKQYRHAVGEVVIEIPGGCVDPGENDPALAVRRELLEETGFEFSEVHYLGKISANASTNSNYLHMFLAQGGMKVKEQDLDKNEEIEVFFASIDELKELIRERKIMQSMHLSCILYALEKLGKLTY